MSSKTFLAGLSVLSHKAIFCFTLVCCVLCEFCESVLALECLSLEGEGRVPSLMTAAVESEVSNSTFFSFVFDVSSMGHSALMGT